jgi:Cu(I)/Ag(I) efflux system membrane fusion protein
MGKKARHTLWGAALLAAVLGAGFAAACARPGGPAAAEQALYHCPMHPTYVSEAPGDCPICGMKLVRMESPAPGDRGPAAGGEEGGAAPGRGVVSLTPERRQLLGVRSEPVRRAQLERVIRTVGRVTVDERRLHHIHTKYEGYVEHLHVDFTGKFVERGEPLASIYSPELVATQQEYLLAWRAQQRLAASGIPSVARGGVDLLEAARQRLRLWDIRPGDIEQLERTGEVRRTLDLHSDVSGYVVAKMALHGMRITPADTLFDIADLSHLWVLADVYESDLPQVRVGMAADVTVPYLPGRSWRGPVTYVAPTVEEKTRTVKVRVEVDNLDDALKPEMFADVLLRSDLGTGLVLPDGAVVRTGDRDLVFVDRGDGRLEPRDVRVGARVQAGYQALGGVEEGERVVTSANFLLDSESSLRAALSAMGTTSSPPPSGEPARPGAAGSPAAPDHRH